MRNKVIIILAAIAVFTSCRVKEKERKGPLHIVTTTGIIEDAIINIVGDSAETTALMGPGTDPHLYRPTPGDIELLDQADVIVSNGLHLEGKMAEVLTKYGKEKPVIKVSDGIPKDLLIKSADFEDSYDPHIWFDPNIWSKGLSYVADELGKIDTNATNYYADNCKAYEKKLEDLTDWAKNRLTEIKDTNRVLITSHDAFSYFGRRFNIEVRGIQGISTLSEVGLKDIADMVDFVIEREIKSIFVETSTSDKTAQSIVDGAKDKEYDLSLDGPLYSDALGEPGGDGGDYIGMVKSNVEVIVNGLK